MVEPAVSTYEQVRLRNIAENELVLQALGLEPLRPMRSQLSEEERLRRAEARRQRAELKPQRASPRLAEKPAVAEAAESKAVMAEQVRVFDRHAQALDAAETRLAQKTGKQRKRESSNARSTPTQLTEQQRSSLAGAEGWMEQMRDWGASKLSDSNLRSVMKVVGLLASGAGVQHTRHKGRFLEGRPITMADDFVALRAAASRWLRPEDDPGHGWRLDHPLGKLALFQRHLLETPQEQKSRGKKAETPLPAAHGRKAGRKLIPDDEPHTRVGFKRMRSSHAPQD